MHLPGADAPLGLGETKRFYEALYSALPDLAHTVVDGHLTESHVNWDVIGIAHQIGLTDRRHLVE